MTPNLLAEPKEIWHSRSLHCFGMVAKTLNFELNISISPEEESMTQDLHFSIAGQD